MENISFGQVIEQLKDGQKLTRRCWRENEYISVRSALLTEIDDRGHFPVVYSKVGYSKDTEYWNEMIFCTNEGREGIFLITSDDIFANDWIVLNKKIVK